jgi:hypothetical protein
VQDLKSEGECKGEIGELFSGAKDSVQKREGIILQRKEFKGSGVREKRVWWVNS